MQWLQKESAMLHLYNSLGAREDLSKQNIQFIHAIRIKGFNIGAGKIPDDFQYQPPLSADIRYVSRPSRRTSSHSSFRNIAGFMEPGASLSSRRRHRKDRHINLLAGLPESWRNMQRKQKQDCVFLFPPQWVFSFLVFLYLLGFTVLVLSSCWSKWVNEGVYAYIYSSFSALSCCYKWKCVHISAGFICICVYFWRLDSESMKQMPHQDILWRLSSNLVLVWEMRRFSPPCFAHYVWIFLFKWNLGIRNGKGVCSCSLWCSSLLCPDVESCASVCSCLIYSA